MLLFLDDRPDDKHEKKKLVTALKGRRGLVPPMVCGIENAVINRLILAFFFLQQLPAVWVKRIKWRALLIQP